MLADHLLSHAGGEACTAHVIFVSGPAGIPRWRFRALHDHMGGVVFGGAHPPRLGRHPAPAAHGSLTTTWTTEGVDGLRVV